jgi:heat shock protein HslJ
MHSLGKHQTVFGLLVAVLFVMGTAKAGTFNLAGSEWGFAGETGKAARFVQFRTGGGVGGYAGCNRFNGSYTQKNDAVRIGPLATTRMACQQGAMEREKQFLAMLSNVRYATGTHLKLILKDGSGSILAELVRRDPE